MTWMDIPPLGDLGAYYRAIEKYPLLSFEEEQEAGKLKDELSIMKLVLSHLRLAASMAREQRSNNMQIAEDELIGEANLGLLEATRNFNTERGVRFSSFAKPYIKYAISAFIMNNVRMARLVTTKPQRALYNNLLGMKLKLLNGTDRRTLNSAEVKQIAEKLSVHEHDVREMEVRLCTSDRSTNVSLDVHADDGGATFEAFLSDEGSNDPVELMIRAERMWVEEVGAEEVLNTFDDRTKFIIKNRYMAEETLTLHELGSIFGISAERVRQIEAKGLKKIRAQLGAYA